MGIIQQLSAAVINQIAAGEVVERPSSVLKEVLENAIDAGATRVDVTVERGGKDLIRVADNGSGMSPDDLPLAFLPHATSKLETADDLYRVRTLGFRGEALAAIAEVSRVRCQTRQADAPEGSELTIDGGSAGPIGAVGCPVGTVIEVRNLFYNVPVRRSFLKSDATEAGHVLEAFTRIALAHPTVHLSFRSGGKVLHDLPAVTGVRDRVAEFFGRELAESLLWVESRIDTTHLFGYVAHPSQSRSSNKGQFLFIGGRFVRDRSLSHALAEAYRGLLMVGRMPVAFLHLELPAEEVDVNVHPTKVEVRFRDGQRIYSQLLSTVRQTFLSSDLHSRLQAPEVTAKSSPSRHDPGFSTPPSEPFGLREGEARKQEVASWFAPKPAAAGASLAGYAPPSSGIDWSDRFREAPAASLSPRFDEFEGGPAEGAPASPAVVEAGPVPSSQRAEAPGPPAADPLSSHSMLKAIQVHDSYLIAETDDGMVVIDQHALHERILYEELKRRLDRGGVESQRRLVPEPVDLTAAEAAAVLEHREALKELGIEIEPFGGDTVLVLSTPAMLGGAAPERLLRDLAEHFRSRPIPPTRDGLLSELLHMIACKAAVKAGQKLSPEEVEALLDRRHLVADSHHCPHGRPTALVFTKSELERQFGRI